MAEEKADTTLPDDESSEAGTEKEDNSTQQEDSLFDHDQQDTGDDSDKNDTGDDSGSDDSEGDSSKDLEKKAPDRYKFITPKGVELDKTLINKFVEIAKAADLDNETAQKVVDIQLEWLKNQQSAYESAVKQAEKEAVEAIEKHPVFGKKDEMAVINKAIEGYAGKMDEDTQKAFREFVNKPMAGKSIEFLSLLHLVGKDISDDKFFDGGKEAGKVDTKKAREDALFPTSPD